MEMLAVMGMSVPKTDPKKHTRKTPDNRVRKIRPVKFMPDGSFLIPAKYGTHS